jgi:hypothetical protein
MPSGMLMVTDSAFTVFDAALGFGLAGAALAGGAVFDELSLCGGALCAAATRLLANINQAIRLLPIFSPIVCTLLRPTYSIRGDEWGAVRRIDY